MASHRIPLETLAAERDRLLAENDRLRQQLRDRHRLADLAGNSRAIRRVCELIDQIAPSARSVCVCGERGVGKTRAARAIHCGSPRSAGPLITVSCVAMSDADVDAQLFGLERGGVPGVVPGGCVGRAESGTLLFREIEELGPLGQRRLLGLVRERAWEGPDGASRPADVRVIAATSVSLDDLVERRTFRPDLWEHLRALTVLVPPLRDRKMDLPVLTGLFVDQFAREHTRAVSRVSERATDMLMNYDWPGNVSQLRQTVERAVVLTTGPVIHHHHLPPEIQDSGRSAAPLLGLGEALDAYEKELLQDALRQTGGVRSQAARLLMTSERVFSYRLRKHGIDSRRFKAPS